MKEGNSVEPTGIKDLPEYEIRPLERHVSVTADWSNKHDMARLQNGARQQPKFFGASARLGCAG